MGWPNGYNIIQHRGKQKKCCIVQHLFSEKFDRDQTSYNKIQHDKTRHNKVAKRVQHFIKHQSCMMLYEMLYSFGRGFILLHWKKNEYSNLRQKWLKTVLNVVLFYLYFYLGSVWMLIQFSHFLQCSFVMKYCLPNVVENWTIYLVLDLTSLISCLTASRSQSQFSEVSNHCLRCPTGQISVPHFSSSSTNSIRTVYPTTASHVCP